MLLPESRQSQVWQNLLKNFTRGEGGEELLSGLNKTLQQLEARLVGVFFPPGENK